MTREQVDKLVKGDLVTLKSGEPGNLLVVAGWAGRRRGKVPKLLNYYELHDPELFELVERSSRENRMIIDEHLDDNYEPITQGTLPCRDRSGQGME